MMKECIIPSYQSFHFVYGSPYLPRMNLLLRRLQEAGILKFLADQMIYNATVEGLLYPSEDYEDVPQVAKPIGMDHMYVPFCFLLMGYTYSIAVFILEIAYYKWQKMKKPKYPFLN